jgi:hypothetical protein
MHCHYGCMVRFVLQQKIYHMFLFGSKIGIGPIDIDLFLCVASYSLNHNKFEKQFTMLFLVVHCI